MGWVAAVGSGDDAGAVELVEQVVEEGRREDCPDRHVPATCRRESAFTCVYGIKGLDCGFKARYRLGADGDAPPDEGANLRG